MKVAIYQINKKRDEQMLRYLSYDQLEKYHGSSDIDSSIYDKVFKDEVACKNLEEVYAMFNLDHPNDFNGRSLSVSDIIEVIKSDDIEKGFYYCDDFGFKKVEFEPSKTKNTWVRDLNEEHKYKYLYAFALDKLLEAHNGCYYFNDPVFTLVSKPSKSKYPRIRDLNEEYIYGYLYDQLLDKLVDDLVIKKEYSFSDSLNKKQLDTQFTEALINDKKALISALKEYKVFELMWEWMEDHHFENDLESVRKFCDYFDMDNEIECYDGKYHIHLHTEHLWFDILSEEDDIHFVKDSCIEVWSDRYNTGQMIDMFADYQHKEVRYVTLDQAYNRLGEYCEDVESVIELNNHLATIEFNRKIDDLKNLMVAKSKCL